MGILCITPMWRDNPEDFMSGFADLDAVTRDAESVWAGDAELRAEFGGNKESYLALRRAEQDGRVKIFVPGAARSQTQQAPLQPLASTPTDQAAFTLAERQAQVRQENVGRQFAGLPVLPIPQE